MNTLQSWKNVDTWIAVQWLTVDYETFEMAKAFSQQDQLVEWMKKYQIVEEFRPRQYDNVDWSQIFHFMHA